ncbi:MAG: LLM class F420-dependent oxidoreductase [Actinomycetota bacterium]
MQVGVIFPQLELEPDPDDIRAYAVGVEWLGLGHISAYEHVLGADPSVHEGFAGPYDVTSRFHEPMVLFGYLAAVTSLELATSVLILPQRQTALVAKQAAQVDLLTGGRLRLGVGVGWNAVEYAALGQDFSQRGRREEEQIELLRRLWTEPSLTFEGRYDAVTGAGLAPLPVQRPIPIWLGGSSEPAYRRMGRLADGWFPQVPPGDRLDQARQIIDEAAATAGRDPGSIGMEGRVRLREGGVGKVVDDVHRWREAGASHVSINTMGAGLKGASQHLDALSEVVEQLT